MKSSLLPSLSKNNPVYQIVVNEQQRSNQKMMNMNSPSSLFENFLHPISVDTFRSDIFRQKALYIQKKSVGNDDTCYYQSITEQMHHLNIKEICETTSSDSIFVWVSKNNSTKECKNNAAADNSNKANSMLSSIEVDDPKSAFTLHQAGHAIYCRAPPSVEQPLVAAFLKGTGIGFGDYDPSGQRTHSFGRGEVETFVGTASHFTNWHTDFQENFTIQLSGKKKWRLKSGTVKHPLRGCTPHYASPGMVESQLKSARLSQPNFQFGRQDLEGNAYGVEEEVVLGPGDVLYFPAGMWHSVETLEPGVSINVSLMGVNYATLVSNALSHLLVQDDAWRELIVDKGDNESCFKLEELLAGLKDKLKLISADTLLPPVVKEAPNFMVDSDVNSESHGIDIEHDDNASHDGDIDQEEVMIDDEEDTKVALSEEEKDDDEDVIDINEFIEDYNLANRKFDSQGIKWKKNPLAMLMRMADVQNFYSNRENSKAGEETSHEVFILNFCYAAHDTHESLSRTVFRVSKESRAHDIISMFLELVESSKDNSISNHIHDFLSGTKNYDSETMATLNFLHHFGFITCIRSEINEESDDNKGSKRRKVPCAKIL